jgi:hypothetical protein
MPASDRIVIQGIHAGRDAFRTVGIHPFGWLVCELRMNHPPFLFGLKIFPPPAPGIEKILGYMLMD